jgi:O-antigen ligase
VLLLLGESFLKIVLMAIGVGILAFFHREVEWRQYEKHAHVVAWWAAFLGWLTFATAFSRSLPVSLASLLTYFFSAVFFIFFLGVKQSFVKRSWILIGIGVLCAWLTLISTFFLFFPNWAHILPGMNLVFSTFGHNHIAAIMVIVLPAAWWLALQHGSWRRWWYFLLPLCANLTLMISFSRVATAVAGLETVILLGLYIVQLWQAESAAKTKRRAFWIRLFSGKALILGLGALALSLMLLLKISISLVATDVGSCPAPLFKKELCKPIKDELRFKYWQSSLAAVQDNPVFGYGLGTTHLVIQRYRLNPTILTSFAHNHFLQVFAETGLIGGVLFMGLMGTLWWQAWQQVAPATVRTQSRRKPVRQWFSLNQALFLGVSANYVVAFFDIDWSFVAAYVLLMVLLAQLLRSSE